MDSKKASKRWTLNVQPLKGTLYGAVTDWHLSLLFAMMQPSTCCRPKRPPTLEVYPSPGSVKFVSVLRENGHLVRRRTVIRRYFCSYFFLSIFNPTSFHIPYLTPFPLMTIPVMFLPLCYMPFTLTTKRQEHNLIGTTRHWTTCLLGY